MGYHQIDIGHQSFRHQYPNGPALNIRPLSPATYFPRTFVRPSFALSPTCRQLYVEASPYIYTLNTFGFDSLAVFDRWTKNRALGQRKLVASIDMPYDYMHLYRGGFRHSFRQKFENIKRIGVDEHVAIFSRKSKNDSVEDAKMRIMKFVQGKEDRDVEVEWHYGVTGMVVCY
jgi:hypothetical protein